MVYSGAKKRNFDKFVNHKFSSKLIPMKNNKQVLIGLLFTIAVLAIATLAGKIDSPVSFIPNSFFTQTSMFILAIVLIYLFRSRLNFNFSLPRFKKIWRPILFGFLVSMLTGMAMGIFMQMSGNNPGEHPGVQSMTPWQMFIFVLIWASISEELLFRGFLQNMLHSLKEKNISLFSRRLSIPVIFAALVFGLTHLMLLRSGASLLFAIATAISTFLVGLVAGYYQEKYNNTAYAILVHMAANLFGLLGLIAMQTQNM